jgi:hypothetical protein
MSRQLESRHFFRTGDTVQHHSGLFGEVIDSMALYAVIRWPDGRREEIDQFDPGLVVVERGARGGALLGDSGALSVF